MTTNETQKAVLNMMDNKKMGAIMVPDYGYISRREMEADPVSAEAALLSLAYRTYEEVGGYR